MQKIRKWLPVIVFVGMVTAISTGAQAGCTPWGCDNPWGSPLTDERPVNPAGF